MEVWDARTEEQDHLPLGPAWAGPFDGTLREYTVVLPREAAYAGRIIDTRGDGVSGVKLTAYAWSESAKQPGKHEAFASGVSTDEGSFRLGGLPRGMVRIFVDPPEGYAHRDSLEGTTGTERAEVILNPAVTATLRIVGEDDEPLTGIIVSVCVPDLDGGMYISNGLLPGRVAGDQAKSDGVVTLPGLDASRTYILRVNWARRFWNWDVLSHVNRAWRPADGVIQLPRAHSISGLVLNERGEPVARAHVRLNYAEDGYWESSKTDVDGAFGFGRRPAGKHTIEAWSPGGDTGKPAAVSATVSAGSSDVILRIPVGAGAESGK